MSGTTMCSLLSPALQPIANRLRIWILKAQFKDTKRDVELSETIKKSLWHAIAEQDAIIEVQHNRQAIIKSDLRALGVAECELE